MHPLFSYITAYDADEHANIHNKLHCAFVRYSHFHRLYHWDWNYRLLSLYPLFGYLKLTGWLGLKLFWLRHEFTTRACLSTMLNTSFGGSDVDDNIGNSCETGGCDESSDCTESVDCGKPGNYWEFGGCGEPGGGDTEGVGEAGDGGEPGSRTTLKSKLLRLDSCLERINCENWNSSFKIRSGYGLLFSLLVHGISCVLFVRSEDIGVDLFCFSTKLFLDSINVFWFLYLAGSNLHKLFSSLSDFDPFSQAYFKLQSSHF